jgi:predicted PurR-regulated permease PerM
MSITRNPFLWISLLLAGIAEPKRKDQTLNEREATTIIGEVPERPHLVKEIVLSLGRYVRGQVLIVLIMSALYAAGFFFVGVPLWWLAGILCGPFHLVPVIGILFAAVIPILFQLAGGGGFWEVVWVLIVLAVVQLLESFFLTPRILGRELRLHPLVVILLVLTGAFLFGPIGALLAAPAVAIGLLIWKRSRTSCRESPRDL